MSVIHNLWPDFRLEPRPRGIRQILEEAGAGLEEKTGGLVHFRVRPLLSQDQDRLRYDCVLFVPKLDYALPICRVVTGPAPFPADLVWEEGTITGIASESQLLARLEELFHSARTREIVVNLMSLAS